MLNGVICALSSGNSFSDWGFSRILARCLLVDINGGGYRNKNCSVKDGGFPKSRSSVGHTDLAILHRTDSRRIFIGGGSSSRLRRNTKSQFFGAGIFLIVLVVLGFVSEAGWILSPFGIGLVLMWILSHLIAWRVAVALGR